MPSEPLSADERAAIEAAKAVLDRDADCSLSMRVPLGAIQRQLDCDLFEAHRVQPVALGYLAATSARGTLDLEAFSDELSKIPRDQRSVAAIRVVAKRHLRTDDVARASEWNEAVRACALAACACREKPCRIQDDVLSLLRADPPRGTWTSTPPTEPGIYFACTIRNNAPAFVQEVEYADFGNGDKGALAVKFEDRDGDPIWTFLSELDHWLWWSEPLILPPPPSGSGKESA